MEDKIPQSFKVQWLNTTLKFVKNDNQMVMEYPEMPIAQVEYLHNLIWQRRNNLGLGFRSLYAPLWEAMKIFSVKYQFQVSVTKAVTGDSGRLKIQKILKSTKEDCNKPPLEPVSQEPDNSISAVSEKPILMHQKTKSTNEECTKVVEGIEENKKVKPKTSSPSKGQKYLAHARKIIDSIAPAFFKKTFQKIFDFISDEASASFTFSDLAPNEAKFLENFLGIYRRRTYFEVLFSPYCNDLLDKMCIIFKEFDKTCKLDICVGKTDSKTCKREIIFLKVPRYTKITTSKAKLSNKSDDQLSSENETDNSSNKFLKALQLNEHPTKDNTSTFISSFDSRAIDTDIETDDEFKYNAKDNENVKSTVYNNATVKNVQNPALVNAEKNGGIISKNKMKIDVEAKEIFVTEEKIPNDMDIDNQYNIGNKRKKLKTIDNRLDNKINETDNISLKAIEKIEDKEKVLESKEKKRVIYDSSVNNVLKNLKELKITISNKEKVVTEEIKDKMRSVYLKDSNNKKTPQLISTDTKSIQGSRKNKLLEAMSTPLESEKALRMMRLMGWEGGALGLRGHGITEPIIPDLHLKPGAGLGHVPKTKKKKKKEKKDEPVSLSDFDRKSANKMELIELPTKKTQYKILILTKVLEFLKDKENLVLNVNFDSILTTKYRTVLEKLCSSVNNRTVMTSKNVPYKDLAVELYKNYDNSFFDITFGLDLKSFTIRKVKETPMQTNSVSKKKKKNKNKTVDAVNKENVLNNGTDKKVSNDTNNNDESSGWSEVVSPKKNKPLILLVQSKTKKCHEDIANLIARKINSEIDILPYLKSHGVQDDYIVYSCYKKKSYLWLKNLLTDYRVIDYRGMDGIYVLQIRVNVCMDFKKVLSLLDLYNPGLHSSQWVVLDVNYFDSAIELLVQTCFNSFDYVRSNNFKLHAGVDEVLLRINVEYYLSYLQVL